MSHRKFRDVNCRLKFLEKLYTVALKMSFSEEFVNAIVKETHRIGHSAGLYKDVGGNVYEIR